MGVNGRDRRITTESEKKMRLVTKRTQVIQMSHEEVQEFHKLMEQAAEGRMSHTAETRLKNGSYLAVSIVDEHEQERQAKEARHERR
jgi:hypothetical protein